MRVLLTGASGFIGRHLQQALLAAGHEVVPISRRYGVDFQQMLTVERWLPHLQGVDAVINSVGMIAETQGRTFAALHQHAPIALFQACAAAGVKRVVQISALGADEQAFTPYQLTKKAADDALRSLPLEWFVLRPSLVYGAGGVSFKLFRTLATLPLIPLVGDGKQRIQPVHISDVVATVLHCLHASPVQRTLDVVGAYPLSFVEWLQILRQQAGKSPARVLPIPLPLVMTSAFIGRFLIPMLHPDNLRMLQRGNTADVAPLVAFLGRMPRSVDEVTA
ncbi:MAG: hypothetical protein RI964_1752 [Pseudomonadota bacterium]|jgi:uncharacterized protein YbjT (DUF2867 family)